MGGAGIRLVVQSHTCLLWLHPWTFWLARQAKPWQQWQVEPCRQNGAAEWLIWYLNEVQSWVNTVDQYRLEFVFLQLQLFGKAKAWPVLQRQPMKLDHLDDYISAVRGRIWAMRKSALVYSQFCCWHGHICCCGACVAGQGQPSHHEPSAFSSSSELDVRRTWVISTVTGAMIWLHIPLRQ